MSLWPLEKLPEVPGGDKLHHAIAYAALMFPAALARPKHLWAIFLFYLAWSGGIELIQPYVNRYGEWTDIIANLVGITSGHLIGAQARFLLRESLLE
ncbi:MAG: VanZ family protein [Methanobacteriota archaeon]|nr:MAG: VanZ family protein [Euryarchaeota archaeon]